MASAAASASASVVAIESGDIAVSHIPDAETLVSKALVILEDDSVPVSDMIDLATEAQKRASIADEKLGVAERHVDTATHALYLCKNDAKIATSLAFDSICQEAADLESDGINAAAADVNTADLADYWDVTFDDMFWVRRARRNVAVAQLEASKAHEEAFLIVYYLSIKVDKLRLKKMKATGTNVSTDNLMEVINAKFVELKENYPTRLSDALLLEEFDIAKSEFEKYKNTPGDEFQKTRNKFFEISKKCLSCGLIDTIPDV